MPADILNYQGNGDLAAGSSGGATFELGTGSFAPAVASLDALNRRRNQVADMNHAQKIADRDKVFGMIANQQTDFDKLLPENQKEARDKIDLITEQLIKNPAILEDREAFAAVQKNIREFNEFNAYAKTNYKTITEDLAAASKIKGPEARKKAIDHVNGQRERLKQNTSELYEPYKEDPTMNRELFFKPIGMTTSDGQEVQIPQTTKTTTTAKGGAPAKTTTTTSTVKGAKPVVSGVGTPAPAKSNDPLAKYYNKTEVHTNLDELEKTYNETLVDGHGEVAKNVLQQYTDELLNNPRSYKDKVKEYGQWNDVIDKANKHRPDGKKFEKVRLDSNGNPILDNEFTREDFQKAMYIAHEYKEGALSSFDKERFEADEKLKKGNAEVNKLNEDAAANRRKSLAMAGYYRAKTDALGPKDDEIMANNPFNEVLSKVQKTQFGNLFVAADDLTPTVKAMLGGVGKDGKTIPLEPLKTDLPVKGKSGVESTKPGYYFKPLDNWWMKDKQGKWHGYTKAELAKDALRAGIKVTDYIQKLVDQGGYQDGELKGANGTGTRISTFQSAKALNNKVTNKDDQSAITDDNE